MNNVVNHNEPKLSVIYIHGLGKTCESSRKFHLIKEKYENVFGFDWSQSDDLESKIKNFINENIFVNDNILIIGSSAGGKVALLMRDILKRQYDTFSMVALLNPLMAKNNRKAENSNILSNVYLKMGKLHEKMAEGLIIYSESDLMIDQIQNVKSVPVQNMFVNVGDDGHNLGKSDEVILSSIDKYLNSFI